MAARAATLHDLLRAIEAQGVTDPRILAAFRAVPRAGFVPAEFASRAYEDRPVPIPHGQVTTQPSLVAQMIAALDPAPDDRVLEIGTGLGYQAAVLSRLCAEVVTIERFADLAREARANLERAGIRNVVVLVGDGTLGAPAYAPFRGIVGAAAAPAPPPPLVEQLEDGGRLVLPIGPGGRDEVLVFEKRRGRLVRAGHVVPACFVRMVGRHGHRDD
ncbi:MAG TPA: protein-L-isoaspartate(D-aspartate) O-methyltransferase [Thermodesulfobacteriota bacterium]|nr:protein-L-isoaspartate(D-aspartate) O-methyltransferase [Thermodesulfobacteriota bacterium]